MPNAPTISPTAIHAIAGLSGVSALSAAPGDAGAAPSLFLWGRRGWFVLIDLQPDVLLAFEHRRRAHQRAHCPRNPSLAANHLAQVFAADTQPQHSRIAII